MGGQGERSLKDCPDLTQMTAADKAEFWETADPRELRRLGDRLMAESLPLFKASQAREKMGHAFAQARQAGGWSEAEVAEILGVTAEMVAAWESDLVKTPESGALVLRRLSALNSKE